MMNAYTISGLLLTILPAAYLITAIFGVWQFRRIHERAPRHVAAGPGVTVLKPLCGDEVELLENLRSFCDQDYPDFQVIFGLSSDKDPAILKVKELMGEFQEHDISLVVDERVHGSNLKISNLLNMLHHAKHDILVVADSDMRVERDYLQVVAATFDDPCVSAATCLYSGTARGGLPSTLGAMFINDWFFPSALIPALRDKLTYCFGATMAARRGAIENIGGFGALANILADDYMLGNFVHRQGQKVALAPYLVRNIVHEPSMRALFLHEVRWARTIKNVKPLSYALSTITEGLFLSVAAAVLLSFGGVSGWLIALPIIIVALLRLALHLGVCETIKGQGERTPWLIPLRDLLSLSVRISSYFGTTVHWREQVLTVRANSTLRDLS
tara:strand:+ start:119 stop:1276 length:1158 start_codon:yes stop_codon:yes gene_type:complete